MSSLFFGTAVQAPHTPPHLLPPVLRNGTRESTLVVSPEAVERCPAPKLPGFLPFSDSRGPGGTLYPCTTCFPPPKTRSWNLSQPSQVSFGHVNFRFPRPVTGAHKFSLFPLCHLGICLGKTLKPFSADSWGGNLNEKPSPSGFEIGPQNTVPGYRGARGHSFFCFVFRWSWAGWIF